MHTVYAMFLAGLQELSHRTTRFLRPEAKLGRNAVSRSGRRAAAAALCSSVHGVTTLARAGASDNCSLQVMSFLSLRNYEILIVTVIVIVILPNSLTDQEVDLGRVKCSMASDSNMLTSFVESKSGMFV
jgi:hypothetical protein